MVKDGVKTTIDSLRTPPSAYSKHIRYGALEFSPLLDSSSISSHGWAQIANAVHDNYHLFDGFVVLHGTDSLSYSASALSFMLVRYVMPCYIICLLVVACVALSDPLQSPSWVAGKRVGGGGRGFPQRQ